MNRENTVKRHGNTIGYIVIHRIHGAATLCHGATARKDRLLFGMVATVFKTRRRADRAIRDEVRTDEFCKGKMSIWRVAFEKE